MWNIFQKHVKHFSTFFLPNIFGFNRPKPVLIYQQPSSVKHPVKHSLLSNNIKTFLTNLRSPAKTKYAQHSGTRGSQGKYKSQANILFLSSAENDIFELDSLCTLASCFRQFSSIRKLSFDPVNNSGTVRKWRHTAIGHIWPLAL